MKTNSNKQYYIKITTNINTYSYGVNAERTEGKFILFDRVGLNFYDVNKDFTLKWSEKINASWVMMSEEFSILLRDNKMYAEPYNEHVIKLEVDSFEGLKFKNK